MNWLDIFIIVVLALLALTGWRAGALRSIALIVGILVGIKLAGLWGGPLGRRLDFITDPNMAQLAAFTIIFLAVLIGASILGSMLRRLLHMTLLGWMDNAAGLVVGVASGVLGITALIVATGSFPIGGLDKAIKGSVLARSLADNVPFVLRLLPEEYRKVLVLIGEVKEPRLKVVGYSLAKSTRSQVVVMAELVIDNSNSMGGTLEMLEYRVYYLEGSTWRSLAPGGSSRIRIAAKGQTVVPLSIEVLEPFLVGDFYRALQGKAMATIKIDGRASFQFGGSKLDVPVMGEEQVSLPIT
ncbi:MAG: CvpA family protein [Chloroflexi bacterium]|nr:CvpA family protein [Chloroflexota bacterium]